MLSYKVPLEAVSRAPLVSQDKDVLYAEGMGDAVDLAKLRVRAGLSQEAVGKALGYKHPIQAVSDWERQGRVPGKHAIAIARLYNVPVDSLPITGKTAGPINRLVTTPSDNGHMSDVSEGTTSMSEVMRWIGKLEKSIEILESRVAELENGRHARPRKGRRTS